MSQVGRHIQVWRRRHRSSGRGPEHLIRSRTSKLGAVHPLTHRPNDLYRPASASTSNLRGPLAPHRTVATRPPTADPGPTTTTAEPGPISGEGSGLVIRSLPDIIGSSGTTARLAEWPQTGAIKRFATLTINYLRRAVGVRLAAVNHGQ
jgi:hypothetical protein